MVNQVTQYLYLHWQQLTRGLPNQTAAEEYFNDLIVAYSQPHRVYHRPEHLQHLISLLKAAKVDDAAVLWSSFYHDYVYEPGKSTNEVKSAAIAEQQLNLMGVNRHTSARVTHLILATKDHLITEDQEAALFLDADMAILGEDRETYVNYVDDVKQEFIRVPQFLYKRGRKCFLRKLLKQTRIFSSDWFYQRFEKSARENINWELNQP